MNDDRVMHHDPKFVQNHNNIALKGTKPDKNTIILYISSWDIEKVTWIVLDLSLTYLIIYLCVCCLFRGSSAKVVVSVIHVWTTMVVGRTC